MSLLMPSFLNPSGLPDGAFMRVVATDGTDTWSVTQQVAPGKLRAFYDFSPPTSYTIHSSCNGAQNVSVINSSGFGIEIDAAVAANIDKHKTVVTGQDGTKQVRWLKSGGCVAFTLAGGLPVMTDMIDVRPLMTRTGGLPPTQIILTFKDINSFELTEASLVFVFPEIVPVLSTIGVAVLIASLLSVALWVLARKAL